MLRQVALGPGGAGLAWTHCLRPCVFSACSDEKCEQCAKWGASNVINYKTEDYAEVVNSRTQVCPSPTLLEYGAGASLHCMCHVRFFICMVLLHVVASPNYSALASCWTVVLSRVVTVFGCSCLGSPTCRSLY